MPDQKVDIHNNEDRLKWNKKKFTNSEHVTQSNKEAVKRFIDKCYAEGLSDARVKKYITNFHTIFKLSEDFKECIEFLVTDLGFIQEDGA